MFAVTPLPVSHSDGFQAGFSLIELSIVLAITALLLSSLLVPLSTQIDQQQTLATRRLLEDIQESLLGFAIANGRLPCPASATSQGVEDPVGGGVCNHSYDGYVPAVTLGIASIDANGRAVDGWGSLLRYGVTRANASVFTTADSATSTGMKTFVATNGWTLAPDLSVCGSATGIGTTNCGTAPSLANNAVAVIFSMGKNWGSGSSSPDEAANLNNDRVFVSHTPSAAGSVNGEFDDIVTWLSPNILYNRMVAAQRLP